MTYDFTFSLSEDEYADYNEFTAWKAPWQKKVRLKYFGTLFLSCFIFSFMAVVFASKKGSITDQVVFKLALPLIVSLIISYIFYLNAGGTIRAKAKKFIIQEENIDYLSENELTVSAGGIVDATRKTSTSYSWSSIVRYAETEKYFFLYTSAIFAIVVPKRLFNNNSDTIAFDKFVTSKIPLSSSFRSMGI